MASVKARITGIESLQNVIAAKEKELEKLRQELAMRNGQLRAEISKGGTTGEPVQDLVLRAGGAINDPILPKYRELQKQLEGKKGDFVMIRYHAKVRQRYGGKSSESDYRHETHFRIGVLTGEQLKLANPITLPVEQYLRGVWQSGPYTVYLEKNPIKGDFFKWAGGDDHPPMLTQYLMEEHLAEDFFIGDEAVRGELKKNRDEKFFNVAAERLGRLILELTEG